MWRHLRPTTIVGLMLLLAVSAWPAWAQTQPQPTSCQLAPTFVMLRDLVGRDRVGECSGPMIRNDNGDVNQPTTRGIMTLRMADLVPAFSDGQTTWLYGPNGLESRPSGGRLPWETTTSSTGSTAPVGSTSVGSSPSSLIAPAAVASPAVVALSTLPITIDGDSSTTSKPLDLAGGDYKVTWEATLQKGKTSCYVGSWLRHFESQNPGVLVLHATLGSTKDHSSSGETRLFSVTPGRYVLDIMTTGCDWKFSIQAP
jgi:hypothetical protein